MNKILDPNLESLQSTLSSMFEIPVYQRPYKWDKEQITEMFEDILDEFQRDGLFFFGTIFLSHSRNETTNISVYEVVDGQQRITTLGLILLVLYASFYEADIPSDDSDVKDIRKYLWKEKGLNVDKDCRLITSGSLEKSTLERVFNWCYDNPKGFVQKIKDEKNNNCGIFEKTFYNNIITIKECIKKYILENEEGKLNGITGVDKQRLFFRYMKESICVITITLMNGVNNDRKKLFEIFESINSKGRKLDEIDLIKSYIFQNIDINDYDTYLGKWGELISKTEDNLENYLAIFVNAKVKYYKNSITIKIFKSFSKKTLKDYYEADTLCETLERFIDDMTANVDNYVKLVDADKFILKTPEFKYYTSVLRYLKYDHPKDLLFRAYCDFTNNIINKKQLFDLTKATIVFMLLFQTLQQKDSRETSGKFETLMNIVYANNGNYCSKVIDQISKELQLSALNDNSIKSMLRKHIGYETQAKKETKVLLGAYEFSEDVTDENNNVVDGKFLFDKMLFAVTEPNIQVDHIAVKRPDKNDSNYSYYCGVDSDNNEILKLKPNSDFVDSQDINDGMLYELFVANILNKTGNLQLMWGSQNQQKSNGICTLPTYTNFNTYKEISERSEDIATKLVDRKFFKVK